MYFKKDEKTPSSFTKAKSISTNLRGLTIALDPGHIGGAWSAMEKRHFSLNDDQPVKEGDLALAVAKNLVPALKQLGAIPVLVRKKAEPVTQNRPEHFREDAVEWAKTVLGEDYNNTEKKNILIRERQELLFYRVDEIRARADLINHSIKPDLVISIHFNAAPGRMRKKENWWVGMTTIFWSMDVTWVANSPMMIRGLNLSGACSIDGLLWNSTWRKPFHIPFLKSPACRPFLTKDPTP